jgi:hypothetical protein
METAAAVLMELTGFLKYQHGIGVAFFLFIHFQAMSLAYVPSTSTGPL